MLRGPVSLPYFVQHNDGRGRGEEEEEEGGGVEELKRAQNVHSVKVGVRNKQWRFSCAHQ